MIEAALLALAPQGGDVPWRWFRSDGVAPSERMGKQVEVCGDVDADGVLDLIVANTPPGAPNGVSDPVIRIVSGRDGGLLYGTRASQDPARTSRFGAALGGLGDFDGDGHDDFFILDAKMQVSSGVYGVLLGLSGRTGSELFRLESSVAERFTGCRQVGDLDGDGHDDLVLSIDVVDGSNGLQRPGAVRAVSSATLATLFRVEGFVSDGRFGHAISALPDLDRDGVPDLLVGAPSVPGTAQLGSGVIYALSGADGHVIRSYRSDLASVDVGFEIAAIGDVDGDLRPDILSGDHTANVGYYTAVGAVTCFSGGDGSVLFRLYGSSEYEQFGTYISAGEDFDGDGSPDFSVFAPGWRTSSSTPRGAVFLYDGGGSEIARLQSSVLWDEFGTDALLVGDLNGDGRSELACGVPGSDGLGGQTCGAVEAYGMDPWLVLRPRTLQAGVAGFSTLEVRPPTSAAGWTYRMLASSGPPGSFWHGVDIPLTPDRLMMDFAHRAYPPELSHRGLSGTLDTDGRAAGFIALGSSATAALAGRTVRFAAVAWPPGAALPALCTSAIALEIRP